MNMDNVVLTQYENRSELLIDGKPYCYTDSINDGIKLLIAQNVLTGIRNAEPKLRVVK